MTQLIRECQDRTHKLGQYLGRLKAQRVGGDGIRYEIRAFADAYYEGDRPKLEAGYGEFAVADIDGVMTKLLRLSHGRSDRRHYLTALKTLREIWASLETTAVSGLASKIRQAETPEIDQDEHGVRVELPATQFKERSRDVSRVFVGSSAEGLDVAYAVQEELEYTAEVTVWSQDVFRPTQGSLESLLRQSKQVDFAVFVFTPDDTTHMRREEHSVARDNVILEFGMFLGTLGAGRVFFLVPRGEKKMHLPTDLLGITPATFDPNRTDGNMRAAVGPACNQMRKAINQLGSVGSEVSAVA